MIKDNSLMIIYMPIIMYGTKAGQQKILNDLSNFPANWFFNEMYIKPHRTYLHNCVYAYVCSYIMCKSFRIYVHTYFIPYHALVIVYI